MTIGVCRFGNPNDRSDCVHALCGHRTRLLVAHGRIYCVTLCDFRAVCGSPTGGPEAHSAEDAWCCRRRVNRDPVPGDCGVENGGRRQKRSRRPRPSAASRPPDWLPGSAGELFRIARPRRPRGCSIIAFQRSRPSSARRDAARGSASRAAFSSPCHQTTVSRSPSSAALDVDEARHRLARSSISSRHLS